MQIEYKQPLQAEKLPKAKKFQATLEVSQSRDNPTPFLTLEK